MPEAILAHFLLSVEYKIACYEYLLMLKNGLPSLLLLPLPPVPVMTEASMSFRRKGTYFQAKNYISISSKIAETTLSIRKRKIRMSKEEGEKKKRRKKKRIKQENTFVLWAPCKYSTRTSLSGVLHLII